MSNMDSNLADVLSEIARLQWAKWDWQSEEALSLSQHLNDAQDVAFYLWDEWLPESLRQVLTDEFGSKGQARAWVAFYAGCHDIGKASYAFSVKVPELYDRVCSYGLGAATTLSSKELRGAPHGAVGAYTLWVWLVENHGFDKDAADTYVAPIGGHHGKFPDENLLHSAEDFVEELEDEKWQQIRFEFFDVMATRAGLTATYVEQRREQGLSAPTQMLLTGIVVMADWLASNTELFPLSMFDASSTSRSDDAIDRLNLPDPWDPRPESSADDLFRARFDLPAGATPYPVQLDAVKLTEEVDKPGLLLLEAPTGEGKTEAALAAAEVLAAKFGCGGVQVALPTCATSDAMFSRVLKWLDRAIAEDQLASAMLTHSRAQFNDEFQGLKFPSQSFSAIYDEEYGANSKEPAVEAHWWLRSRKTAALADFTVGTIDQFLFSALQSKHVMLRHLGLAGKVLILDEVHAADIYMQQYLYRALEWCGVYGVPVIALSATLPPDTRFHLMEAYASGIAQLENAQISNNILGELEIAKNERAYPLLTFVNADGVSIRKPEASSRRQVVSLEYCDDSSVVSMLTEELRDGGCAVVVCNTVQRAQTLYDEICADGSFTDDEVFLLHSRFAAADRRDKEEELVAKYGKSGVRPRRGVVVSTQIVEQSLDLDFDIMFSDFAPSDLLIQRAGRLHRHSRKNRPERLQAPRLVLFGVTEIRDSDAPEFVSGSKRIYGTALLMRTASALMGRKQFISPDHVAGIVRETYDAAAQCPFSWRKDWDEAVKEQQANGEKLAEKAKRSLGPSPNEKDMSRWFQHGSAEEFRGQSQVRDIEESIEVVLVEQRGSELYSLPWLEKRGGESLSDANGVDDELAREVAKCTISLPYWQVGGVDEFIAELERFGSPSWQLSSWLKGLLPLPLNESGQCHVNGVSFSYDMKYGLRSIREKESR